MARRTAPVAPVAAAPVAPAIPTMPAVPVAAAAPPVAAPPAMPAVPVIPVAAAPVALPVAPVPVAPVPVAPVPVASGMVAPGTPLPPLSPPGSSVLPVASETATPVAPVVPLTPAIPMGPISDEELDSLFDEAERLVPADTEIEVRHMLLTPANKRLCLAFHERNKRNRLMQESLVNDYCSLMLTNVKDAYGKPLFGITGWAWTLPVIIFMDNEDSMHNGQHCTMAWQRAVEKVEKNAGDIARGLKTDINYAELGITLDSLKLHVVLVRGIDPDSADYIDTNRKRTTADVVFRNRDVVFSGLDYSPFAKKDGSFDNLLQKQNQEANYLSTALKIIAWRKWYRGEFVRGGSKGGEKFEAAAFNAAFQEFPQVVESVHRVFTMMETDKDFKIALKGSGKRGNEGFTPGINVSVPYLMASHYLAAMAYAQPSQLLDENGQPIPDGQGGFRLKWTASPEAFAFADGFIRMVVMGPTGGDPSGRFAWISSLREMFKADPKDPANEPGREGALPTFARDNHGLKMIWNALGWAFRNYINPADLINSGSPNAGDLRFLKSPESFPAIYGNGSGFDPVITPTPQVPTPAAAPPQKAS